LHIRVKSTSAAQEMIVCRVVILEALERDVSADHSAIEADLLDVRESTNRAKRELLDLVREVRSIGFSACGRCG
jgi:hypothetical protein